MAKHSNSPPPASSAEALDAALYRVKVRLLHDGVVYEPGTDVMLTEAAAAALPADTVFLVPTPPASD